ncbi:hypothetical protein [Sphingomonas sp. GM_Shp_1]|uniref:hypothetical protein n=1 Tax=Sphingomonas sp. GM_Shp_1 TaxID=2937381 RepID=UPI00226BB779|nr:hypothetical protein [Sphingomonas sp. GM_Shp_1]
MTATVLLLGLTIVLRLWPTLPVSRWLARMLVDAPARRLHRVAPVQWGVMILGVALIGLAIWFEMDEIRMLAMAGGSMGDLVMMASAIEWGGIVELGMAAIFSSTMLSRWPVVRGFVARRSSRRTVRARRAQRPANDSGDSEGQRFAA